MKIIVRQEALKLNFSYNLVLNQDELYYGKTNRVIFLKFREISLYDSNHKIVGELKEVNKFFMVLNFIPILNLFLFRRKFIINIDERYSGEILVKANFVQAKASIIFNNDNYMVYRHTNEGINRYSIYLGNEQIGMITKSPYSECGNDNFTADFNNDTNKIFNMLMVLFIDAQWHTTDIPTEIEYMSRKYERGLDTLFGVKLNKDWRPK